MSEDSGLQLSRTPDQPPVTGDTGRYRTAGDGLACDLLLDRTVAVRTADAAQADDLQREARFLAGLDHAGLPCVHDFVRGDGGAVLVTRTTRGRSLTAAVVAAGCGELVPAIDTPSACALTFIKICDALVAAHLRGVVHRALVPDTILLADDGQVVVDGWQQALAALNRPATLRFIANAPVPAALPLDGLHEDIRSIGVCLYTALVREAPPRESDGRLAATTFDAALRIPAPLEAVVRKAMASDAATGYRSVAEVRNELERFLAGQSPQAFRPGRITAGLHWLEVNRRAVLLATLIVALAAGTALAFTWNEVKTYAAWGPPLVDEHFDDNSWKDRWTVRTGDWELKDGRLSSTGEYDSFLVYKQRLTAPVAIEYTAQFDASVRPGDLSVWWCEDDAFSTGKSPFQIPSWFLQAGAYENSWCTIWQSPGSLRSAVANLRMEPGVKHRIRAEIEGGDKRMWVDGVLVLEHQSIFPATSGTIALFGYYAGKQFDDVRIWQREVPELISPLAIGDQAYVSGRFADAANDYARVAASHAGRPLGDRARYLQGLALRRAGDRDAAWKVWQAVGDAQLRGRAECLAIDDLIESGQVIAAAERFAWMWTNRPDQRDELRSRWQLGGQQLRARKPVPAAALEAWISVRSSCFPNDQASAWVAAEMLLDLGRWDELLRRFPEEHRATSMALLALGRSAEVADSSWAISNERIMALMAMGRVEAALASSDMHRDKRMTALCKLGRAEESLTLARLPALYYLGRAEEIADDPASGSQRDGMLIAGRLEAAATAGDSRALILLGRIDEAKKAGADVTLFSLLDLLRSGRLDKARTLRPQVQGNLDGRKDGQWFAAGAGLAMVDAAFGDTTALRSALQRGSTVTGAWGGRMAAVCSAALDAGSDAAVEGMPWRSEVPAWLQVTHALRAELAQDRPAALAAWQAFVALPGKDRLLDGNSLNLELEAFARWRIAALADAP